MRFMTLFTAALVAALGLFTASAGQAAELSIVFSGNSWGYLKPCPT